MTAPENEQTDIIPALRPEAGDTAVDAFAPVAGARHRRPSRPRLLPVAGVAAIVVAGVAAMYATYTLGGHTPTVPAPAPSVVSEEPIAVEPPSLSSPVTRPSRTKADRHRPRPTRTKVTRTPTPAPTVPSPSPSGTSPSPAPETNPTTAPPASEQPDPPPTEAPQSPTSPEVEPT